MLSLWVSTASPHNTFRYELTSLHGILGALLLAKGNSGLSARPTHAASMVLINVYHSHVQSRCLFACGHTQVQCTAYADFGDLYLYYNRDIELRATTIPAILKKDCCVCAVAS